MTSSSSLPSSWDWRAPGPHARMPALGTTNVCSRVLNQRGVETYCGACWVFAAVSALCDRMEIQRRAEGAAHGPPVVLSVQALLNCAAPSAGSCEDGGYARGAYEYMRDVGLPSESCAEYVGKRQACTPLNTCKTCVRPPNGGNLAECTAVAAPRLYRVSSFGVIPGRSSAEAIMREVYEHGPVVACVNGEPLERCYAPHGSAIFTDEAASQVTDHVVCIIGWGEEGGVPFWWIRNSWGDMWGVGGFGRVLRGRNCLGIETFITHATPAAA